MSTAPNRSLRTALLLLGDLGLGVCAYTLLAWLKFGGPIPAFNREDTLVVASISIVATVIALYAFKAYRDLHRPFLEVAVSTILSVLVGSAAAMMGAYVLNAAAAPRSVIGLAIPTYALLLNGWRLVFVLGARKAFYKRPVIVIHGGGSDSGGGWGGANEAADVEGGSGLGGRHLPPYVQVVAAMAAGEFLRAPAENLSSNLWFVTPDVRGETRRQVMERLLLHSADVILVPEVSELVLRQGYVTQLGDTPVFQLEGLQLPSEYRVVKRIVDVIGALVLLLVFTPTFLLVPIANRLFAPGPTFLVQERVGRGGRPFNVIKFRSMIPDAERETGVVVASENDRRITPVGRVLRATRLDEVPQFFNVLKGEMSLVGPRPERPELTRRYAADEPHFRLRERVKPGITGLAQVTGRYDTSPANKLRFDLMYITSYTPWLDVQILIWTVQLVLFPQRWLDSQPAWLTRLENGLRGRERGGRLGPLANQGAVWGEVAAGSERARRSDK